MEEISGSEVVKESEEELKTQADEETKAIIEPDMSDVYHQWRQIECFWEPLLCDRT